MRFKPLNKSDIKVGDVLVKYFTQKEWAIYKVINKKELENKIVFFLGTISYF